MAWTTPESYKPGDVVGEGEGQKSFNTYLRDNLAYLKDNKLDALATLSTPSRALETVYQNDSGKVRLVAITCEVVEVYTAPKGALIYIYCDANSNPVTPIAVMGMTEPVVFSYWENWHIYCTVLFVVPADYYYKASKSGAATANVTYWNERDLGA